MKRTQVFMLKSIKAVMAFAVLSLVLIACQKENSLSTELNEEQALIRNAEQIQQSTAASIQRQALSTGFTAADATIGGRKATQNIAEIAIGNPNFSALVAAVVKTGLAGAISDPAASLTVFAPTDAAFAELPAPFNTAANIAAITDNDQIDFLRNVLLYHVVGQELLSPKVPVGRTALTTLKPQVNGNDNTIYVSKAFNVIKVNGQTEVIVTNVDATNGVIHVINSVLLPPSSTIAAVAIDNPAFSSLVAALVKTDLASVFFGEGNFTVFAPTNDAFAKLPAPFNSAANISAITDAAQISALSNILRYHVLGERYFGWDFGVLNKQTTLADGPKNQVRTVIGMPVGSVKGNANAKFSKVEPGDILCTNGVIHVIGDVLLP
jgi:uncharacterized surface protein with fasciclin (FAS1) repeats